MELYTGFTADAVGPALNKVYGAKYSAGFKKQKCAARILVLKLLNKIIFLF